MNGEHQHLFIDFEFTMPEKSAIYRGFFPEIIEAGFVTVASDKITNKFSSFVSPVSFPVLSNRCKSFLNISQEQVDGGISFFQLVNKLREVTNGGQNLSVITWGNMDMKVLRQNCQRSNINYPFSGKEIDLSMEYKRFFGDRNQTGLWKAVQAYGKEGTGKHHRALDDAITTYNIFRLVEKDKRYMQKHEPTTIGDLVDLSKLFNNKEQAKSLSK